MVLYAVINSKDQKMVLITDLSAEAKRAVDEAKNPGEYTILSTDKVIFGCGARAEISALYEEDCVRDSVFTRLDDKGIDMDTDPDAYEKLASDIAADAYHDIMKYDVSEDYAIDEAMKAHAAEIDALLAKQKSE